MKRASRIAFILIVLIVGVIAAGVAVLKSMDFNAYREVIAGEVRKAIGRDLAIAGNLDLEVSFTPKLTVEGVTLANASWGTRPQMAKLGRLSAEVDLWPLLSGEARVTRLTLSGLDILLEADGQGRKNWQFAATTAAAGPKEPLAEGGGKLPIVPVVKEIVVEKATVAYRDAAGAGYRAALDDLKASTAGANAPIDIQARGRVGDAPFALDGRIGSIADLLGGTGPYPVKAMVKAFATDLSVDGAVVLSAPVPDVDVAVAVKAANLSATAREAAAAAPGLSATTVPAIPLDLTGRLHSAARGYVVDGLKVALGTSDLAGRVAIATTAVPGIEAELTAKRIDVAGLTAAMPPAGKTPPPATTGAPARLFPTDPLPAAALRGVTVKAALRADRVTLPGGLDLVQAALDIRLEKGVLRVEPLRASLADGTIEGAVTMDAGGQPVAIDARLDGKGVVAAKLLAGLGVADLLQGGPTDVTVRLKGRGASVAHIMAGLNGEATVRVGEGRIRNKALDIAGADVVMQLANALNPMAAKEDYTALSCAAVRFQVKDGVAKADKGIAAETDKVNLVGSGAVDLKTEELDFAFKPEAREGLGINLGGALAGLVRVRGTLAKPSVGLDDAGAAKTAVSIGAALATGGLSVLGEALVKKSSQDPHPCRTALGETPPPAGAAPAAQAKPAEAAPAKPDSGIGQGAKDALEGVGKALKGLFGGGK